MLEARVQVEIEQAEENGAETEGPIFDKEQLFVLMKIMAERRSANSSIWEIVIDTVEDHLI